MRLSHYFFVLVLLVTPAFLHAQREKLPPEDLAIVKEKWPEAKRTSTSLRYIVLTEGQGESPKPGDLVRVVYKGSLLNGKVFDEALDPAKAFEFRVGRGNVIDGWDQALQLMRPGEKRLLIIPHELAYGTRGQPPGIPKRATLVFEVQLLDFKK